MWREHARIVLMVGRFPTISETFIINKFVGLLQRGFDVHMVCNQYKKSLAHSYYPNTLIGTKHRIHVWNPFTWRGLWMWKPKILINLFVSCLAAWAQQGTPLRFSQNIRRYVWQTWRRHAMASLGPALVHFEFGTLAQENITSLRDTSWKNAVSFRGYDIEYVGLDDPHFYNQVWEYADAFHVLGADLKRRADKRGLPLDAAVFQIPPGINFSEYEAPFKIHKNEVIQLTTVARLDWKKGIEYAIEAVALLKNRGFKVMYQVIGEGSYREYLKWVIDFYDVHDCVILCGSKNKVEVKKYLFETDIFIMASVSEGFCNAVLEAQASGLPVVCSDAAGLPENVAHNETGYVVPRRSAKAIADAVETLICEPHTRERMGGNGQTRVKENFSLEKQIDAFESMYRTLLEESSSRQTNVEVMPAPIIHARVS